MTYALWYLLAGFLMFTRGIGQTSLNKLPITPAIFYLAIGILMGPTGLHLFSFDPIKQSKLLESLTEIAVLISLFSAGIKMPVPFEAKKWQSPFRLASLSMIATVGLVAGFTYGVFHLPIGASILLGGILAPTDPVLATDVQSRYPGDRDVLRFTLTSEAGMNDGTAFPFVMLGLGLLGLHNLGEFGWIWLLKDVVWAISAALVIGVLGGVIVSITVWRLREKKGRHEILDDLVGLGLIALVYGLSLSVSAWGFVAVFFAAVALRHTEFKLAKSVQAKPNHPAASLQENSKENDKLEPATVSSESLVFKEHLERLSELILVFLVGGMLSSVFWNWQTISLAIYIFIIARPLSTFTSLLGTDTSIINASILGWFGVRGIGSIYYLMYAIQHGLPDELAIQLTHFTLVVVTLSVLAHGISVKPILHLKSGQQSRQKIQKD